MARDTRAVGHGCEKEVCLEGRSKRCSECGGAYLPRTRFAQGKNLTPQVELETLHSFAFSRSAFATRWNCFVLATPSVWSVFSTLRTFNKSSVN